MPYSTQQPLLSFLWLSSWALSRKAFRGQGLLFHYFTLNCFPIHYLCTHPFHGMCVQVRGQLATVGPPLPPRGSHTAQVVSVGDKRLCPRGPPTIASSCSRCEARGRSSSAVCLHPVPMNRCLCRWPCSVFSYFFSCVFFKKKVELL